MKIGDDDNAESDEDKERYSRTHSGLDFSDDDAPTRRRNRRRSNNHFGDSRHSERVETWHEDPFTDEPTEYLCDEPTAFTQGGRRYSTAYGGGEERMSRLDDGMVTALGANLNTGAEGFTSYGDSFDTEEHPLNQSEPSDDVLPHQLEHEASMTAILGDNLKTGTNLSNGSKNPFTPPVPPLPSSISDTMLPASQTDPHYSEARSISHDDYQNRLSQASRPVSYQPSTSRSVGPMTPGTSSLLPWLNRKSPSPTPPVPQIPMPQRPPLSRAKLSSAQQAPMAPARAPPAPFMAQTPMAVRGDAGQGVIPQFR